MSNLQDNAHDTWDEDERQKIYLITIAWRKKNQACRDCNPSEGRSKTSTWSRSLKNIKHVEIMTQAKMSVKLRTTIQAELYLVQITSYTLNIYISATWVKYLYSCEC